MRSASPGRMSSMYSGSIQLCIEDHQEHCTDENGDQSDEAKLSVGEFGKAAKCIAPCARSDERKQTFEHQHERARGQKGFRHSISPFESAGLLASARTRRPSGCARLLEILEELGARIKHHDVALVSERRLVCLEAAVERVELRILTVGGGVDRGRFGVSVALGLLRLLVSVGQ